MSLMKPLQRSVTLVLRTSQCTTQIMEKTLTQAFLSVSGTGKTLINSFYGDFICLFWAKIYIYRDKLKKIFT